VRAQLAFRDGLGRLARAGIPSFVVHGNHDPVEEGWSAVRRWPDGVTLFGAGEIVTLPVERDGQTLALVHGISYRRRAVTENLALRFRRDPANCFQVAVLHCNAGANAGHERYSPCSVEDLAATGIDYWALGHVHLRQFLSEGQPWIAYPGNLQALSPKPSERGAKGALLVDVDDGRVTNVEFLPLDVVRFDELQLDVAGIADVAGLIETLVEAVHERAATHDGRAVILRVCLTGRGPIHRDLRRGHVRDYVLYPARTALVAATQSLWLDSVEDRTSPEIDVESLRGRGDFAADLLKTVDSLVDAPASRSELIAPHLEDLPRGDLRRLVGEAVDAAPAEEEIRSALEVALDRVMEVE
jgi:DNA repair exonuclease SbcCD nuclease subunit